jgi:putative transposase
VVRVCGKGSGRLSVAGLACYRPGARGRLFYRVRVHRGRKGERRSMSEADYAQLVTAAHHQLAAPVILIWDNLNTHISQRMRVWIDARADWLTVERLPAYAPELNAVESAWAHMKNSLGNLAVRDVTQLAAIVKNRLKSIQYHPGLIDGFLAQTGLTCSVPSDLRHGQAVTWGAPVCVTRPGAVTDACLPVDMRHVATGAYPAREGFGGHGRHLGQRERGWLLRLLPPGQRLVRSWVPRVAQVDSADVGGHVEPDQWQAGYRRVQP